MSTCEFAAQAVRMEMGKVADAGIGHGRGRGCSGGSKLLRHPHADFECGVKSARDSSKKYAELAEYDSFIRRPCGQMAAWSRLAGRHRSQKR